MHVLLVSVVCRGLSYACVSLLACTAFLTHMRFAAKPPSSSWDAVMLFTAIFAADCVYATVEHGTRLAVALGLDFCCVLTSHTLF